MRASDRTRTQLRWTTVEEETTLPGLAAGERVTYPEFRDVEFVHVAAKSLVNHVPAASGMPFEWTINVYRGCTHACTYCLAGDTRILLADGSTRRLAEIRVGDRVVGTFSGGAGPGGAGPGPGATRRYVATRVHAHWRTRKPAYRVQLDDGTELVAGGDHRFLTPTGWKHVAAAPWGTPERPFLTSGDELEGPGGAGVSAPSRHGPVTVRERLVGGAPPLALGTLRRHVTAVEPLGADLELFDLTTGTGDFVANGVVSHNCFARPTHEYLELNAGRDFERVIVVKVNAVERLRAELSRPTWAGHHIALGTNTDPYQRCEGRYRLTRGVVETLTAAGNPFSVLTKGTLALRDLDVFVEAAQRCGTSVSFSIPTLDETAWKGTEPGTPHPRSRMDAVATLNEAGVPSGVMLAPVIPGVSDDPAMIEQVVKAAVDAGATHLTPIGLHLRPGVREVFLPWLAAAHPELVDRYRRLYRRSYLPKAERDDLGALVRTLIERHAPPSHPLRRRPRPPRGVVPAVPAPATSATSAHEQLGLPL